MMEEKEPEDTEEELNLHTVPIEIILHIFSFLDARFVNTALSLVCKKLYFLIQDNATWRIRFGKQWPSHYPYPASPDCEDFDWRKACIEREDPKGLWSNLKENFLECEWNSIHYSSIDSVHFIGGTKILATGSRDRGIKLWRWDRVDPEKPNAHKSCLVADVADAHRGWIWDLQSSGGDTLVSGSWDTKIKIWKIRGSECTESSFLKSRVAVLSLSLHQNLLAAGGYDGKVQLYDPRAGFKPIRWYTRHNRSVLCLSTSDNYIMSGSEDTTMVAWDIRAGKPVKTIVIQDQAFPLCMSYKDNMAILGDKLGRVHVIDATNGNLRVVKTYKDIHTQKIHGVFHSFGQIITCSQDSYLKVWKPGKLDPPPPPPPPNPLPEGWKRPPPPKPQPVYSSEARLRAELASVDVSQQLVVATGSTSAGVRLWIPRDSLQMDNQSLALSELRDALPAEENSVSR